MVTMLSAWYAEVLAWLWGGLRSSVGSLTRLTLCAGWTVLVAVATNFLQAVGPSATRSLMISAAGTLPTASNQVVTV